MKAHHNFLLGDAHFFQVSIDFAIRVIFLGPNLAVLYLKMENAMMNLLLSFPANIQEKIAIVLRLNTSSTSTSEARFCAIASAYWHKEILILVRMRTDLILNLKLPVQRQKELPSKTVRFWVEPLDSLWRVWLCKLLYLN